MCRCFHHHRKWLGKVQNVALRRIIGTVEKSDPNLQPWKWTPISCHWLSSDSSRRCEELRLRDASPKNTSSIRHCGIWILSIRLPQLHAYSQNLLGLSHIAASQPAASAEAHHPYSGPVPSSGAPERPLPRHEPQSGCWSRSCRPAFPSQPLDPNLHTDRAVNREQGSKWHGHPSAPPT